MDELLNLLPENTPVREYIAQVSQTITDNKKGESWEKYHKIITENEKIERCFLSVVVRTQGKRADGLREAMLCLNAQSCNDFEVILIAHKATKEQIRIVKEIIADQEEEFAKKIRFYELAEGSRAVPLNFGLAQACGEYAAFYDDDDILFANWVENFKKIAGNQKGRILHAYAFSQTWTNLGEMGYRADSEPKDQYCMDFNELNQLTVNRCPLMTLAFPTAILQQFGFRFSEELDVMEDWDFFMRMSFLFGVSDARAATATYRFWNNFETSATLHNQESWDATYKSVQCGFDTGSVIVPKGSIGEIIRLQRIAASQVAGTDYGNAKSRLYFSTGTPFDDKNVLYTANKLDYPNFDFWFVFPDKRDDVTALRFDLSEEGMFIMDNLKIDVWMTDGKKNELTLRDCAFTGLRFGEAAVFLHEDPEIVWEWNNDTLLDAVHVYGNVSHNLPRTKFLNLLEVLTNLKMRKYRKKLAAMKLF